jgi:SAM-dependent MidA family methyltransferase
MNALADKIARIVDGVGPLSIADYMALALTDPDHGYYTTHKAIGLDGDFVTAPEISQMFGELIGLWCIGAWEALGRPAGLRLVELGPGRGTLMADLLRAASIRAEFIERLTVHLVEISPALRRQQRSRINAGLPISWHDRPDDVPAGPVLVVANEFFDALPIRQYVKTPAGWRERLVGLGEAGELMFGVGAGGIDARLLPEGAAAEPEGSIAEINRPAEAIMAGLADRLKREGGAALAFDYGYVRPGFGDTLQAVRAHKYADPLDNPGDCDLTAHVDFAALARTARNRGATVHGPVSQGDFLIRLGLLERAGMLGAGKPADRQAEIVAAVERLAGPEEMGTLFKVMAVSGEAISLPGFSPD